jgi:hypothetical protein
VDAIFLNERRQNGGGVNSVFTLRMMEINNESLELGT